MLRRMDSRELTEWLAFYTLEPFGGETVYLGHAITAATVANSNRGKSKKAAKVEDFMPKFERPHETSINDAVGFARALTLALGGVDQTGGGDG